MADLVPGQILWVKARFNNSGDTSASKHPYLVVDIDSELNTVEVVQLDSLEGKLHKAMRRSNKVIYNDDPPESVISKDSFAQLDNIFKFEYYDDISRFRQTTDTLSKEKLNDVIEAYHTYQNEHQIDENKIVYMNQDEIEQFNQ